MLRRRQGNRIRLPRTRLRSSGPTRHIGSPPGDGARSRVQTPSDVSLTLRDGGSADDADGNPGAGDDVAAHATKELAYQPAAAGADDDVVDPMTGRRRENTPAGVRNAHGRLNDGRALHARGGGRGHCRRELASRLVAALRRFPHVRRREPRPGRQREHHREVARSRRWFGAVVCHQDVAGFPASSCFRPPTLLRSHRRRSVSTADHRINGNAGGRVVPCAHLVRMSPQVR